MKLILEGGCGYLKVGLSVFKADIGSIGGHTRPSDELLGSVRDYVKDHRKDHLIDTYVGYTGDDIHVLLSHQKGVNSKEIHELAWYAFKESISVAKNQGLYGAGQDILKDSFSGNVRGMGPGVAEMEFEERPNEAIALFTADKTEPGAFNWPLYRLFCEPSAHSGLILNPDLSAGVEYSIMDVMEDRIAKLQTWVDLPMIAAALMYPGRYVVESVHLKDGEPVVAATTDRLHNIAGKYVGKDDPAMLVRLQKRFPATEEACFVFSTAHYVAGDTRGSHHLTLMPVLRNQTATSYYCNPMVSANLFSMHNGIFTAPVDGFEGPNWDRVRRKAALKSELMRDQGFVHPATLIPEELEYAEGFKQIMGEVEKRFVSRRSAPHS